MCTIHPSNDVHHSPQQCGVREREPLAQSIQKFQYLDIERAFPGETNIAYGVLADAAFGAK
jgi:hypothetical protein